ncbi:MULTISPECIES: S41 family peptidase [Mediterranea]|uniref:S41 family peptidase n=1 Tax=Mediterranea TaxID=1926659 RepID=UPI0020131F95|nr:MULTISPECIES: S41 family peptidase [Mediterranea]MCL1608876.1 S41 family peptidase [Mediterranea sp. ET5]MDM8122164.1 S41 family peptidase [Mediterranea massiliensis]MDM8197600.1 S41 family peptidase [Mediterranea massiliensis]
MKKILLSAAACVLTGWALAQESPLWMRDCTISPDGTTIAFTYKGDIYTVPVSGGRAMQLTSHPAYDTAPVWSPDSKKIAFASDRMGSLDVFIVSREGGVPQRLTTHSGSETPIVFKDNGHVLFAAAIQPSAEDMQFPSGTFNQVYEVSVEGGRPRMFSSMPMEHISIRKDGKQWLYQDKKGYEDPWRKHHKSSIARDVWMYTPGTPGSYAKLTAFRGEDRDPVWAPDGESFYYLSEENGTFNVFKRRLGSASSTQITRHTVNPVRFLSIAENGTLCYGLDGEIYTLAPGKQPKKVKIEIMSDRLDRDVIRQVLQNGVSEMAVSPDGDEIAFIVHGDVYVTSVEYKTTKQITDTPEQERDVDFSPDGRSLVYASERDGLWQIYQASLVKEDEKQFTYATEIKEERLTKSSKTSFQPQYSPDGKEVAFLEDRTAIRVMNLKSKKVRTVMDKKYQYSYSDGDQWFQWSPDSKWILSDFIGVGGWNNKDIVLLKADGKGEMHNLTQSGYNDGRAKWVLGGKAMIWSSDRAGFRSHGSWGAESDVYIMFFDLEAYEKFRMNDEDLALYEEAEKERKMKEAKEKAEQDKKKKGKKHKKDDKKEKEEEETLAFDLENCRDRVMRLTANSSLLGDALLSKDGNMLYYLTSFEGPQDLWVRDLKEGSTRILVKGIGRGYLVQSKQGGIFICGGGGMREIDMRSGRPERIEFEAFFNYRPYAEREYIFEHAWQQVKDKFYMKDLHGVDWNGYKKVYEKFLPYINNNYDFAEMLSELLGELNASHTGARYSGRGGAMPTASLGVFYDETYKGDGLKIKEIPAKSPFAQIKTKVTEGCIIEQIDGREVKKGEDYFPLLEGKVGRKIRLAVYNPDTKERFEETIRGIGAGQWNEVLYHRWVERNRTEVERLSGGRLGYIHIEAMNSESFRETYSELLGRYRHKEAVVVDVRHNGGGWLHEDLMVLLGGKEYQRFVAQGQYIGSDPFNQWTKPSCMLVCEDNYSNAHGTPQLYQALKLGKLVGAPVPGTMTAVWWENQIDPSLVFGIPQVGCVDMEGNYAENHELEPDVLIYNSPADVLQGRDAQLEAAVKTLLDELPAK